MSLYVPLRRGTPYRHLQPRTVVCLTARRGAFSITLRRACSRTRRRPSRGTVAASAQTAGFHPTTQEPTMANDSRHHAETKDEYYELNYVKDHKSDYDDYVKQHHS